MEWYFGLTEEEKEMIEADWELEDLLDELDCEYEDYLDEIRDSLY